MEFLMQKDKRDYELLDAITGKGGKAPYANARPIDGYVLLVDGKFKTQFQAAETAMAAGLTLKERYPVVQVQIYDAVRRSYAPVELAEGAVKPRGE